MPFQPEVNQELVIDGVAYRVAPHPASPSMAYGQEGRQGVVYQIVGATDRDALKVFKPRHRVPAMVNLAERLAAFAELPGLAVCQRVVLSARRHVELLRQYPDLTYGVLMPWIDGPTWTDIIADKRELAPSVCLNLARAFLGVLTAMEEQGVAHCDLSGPNVVLPVLAEPNVSRGPRPDAALVDVEGMYGPGLERPEVILGGSPGYAKGFPTADAWDAKADRFTGALLLAEMLGWCDQWVRQAAWGESYFDPVEVQTDCVRYYRLATTLRERWGESIAGLFERAWYSDALADCPTFGDWLVGLPELPVEPKLAPNGDAMPLATAALLARAQSLEESGDLAASIGTYEQILGQVPSTSGIGEEIQLILPSLRDKQARQTQLEHRAEEARRNEDGERWAVAAAQYESLLGEANSNAHQRATWQVNLERCQEEVTLATMFDTATAALIQQQWEKARDELREVLRRRPSDYVHNGMSTRSVLADVEKQLGDSKRRPRRVGLFGGAGALVVVATLLVIFFSHLATVPPFPTTVATTTEPAAVAAAQFLVATPALVQGTLTIPASVIATVQRLDIATVVTRPTTTATEVTTERVQDTATAVAGASPTEETRLAATRAQGSQTAVAQATSLALTVAAAATVTITPSPPSTELAATATAELPTATPARPTATRAAPTRTTVSLPTSAPPATAVPAAPASAAAPVLSGSTKISGSIVLSWSYPGQLGPDDYFDIRVWKDSQPANGIANVKQSSYTIGGSFSAGTYNWTIAVIRRQNGTVQTLAVAGQTLGFTWAPAGGGAAGSGCTPGDNC